MVWLSPPAGPGAQWAFPEEPAQRAPAGDPQIGFASIFWGGTVLTPS